MRAESSGLWRREQPPSPTCRTNDGLSHHCQLLKALTGEDGYLSSALLSQFSPFFNPDAAVHLVLCRVTGCRNELRVVLFDGIDRISQHLGYIENTRATSQHVACKR